MRKTAYATLICVALAIAQSPAPAPQFTPTVAAPELHLDADNLGHILSKLYEYAQSGQYTREINQVVKPAHDWIETRAARATPNEKLAAIFDIDETALSNLPNMMNCGFCSTSAQAKLFPENRIPGIPPVRDLYDFAKSKGIAVILLTGRYESGRDLTINELQAAGYSGWQDLLMRPSGNSDPARIMKAGVRQSVERKGYRIVLNIGDQLSDLIGGYSERTYKLPNPFYFVE
jgi:predicted secreted acid phosphatase